MNRRGFLASILAAGVAPAAVGSGILMPVRKIVVEGFTLEQMMACADGEYHHVAVVRSSDTKVFIDGVAVWNFAVWPAALSAAQIAAVAGQSVLRNGIAQFKIPSIAVEQRQHNRQHREVEQVNRLSVVAVERGCD